MGCLGKFSSPFTRLWRSTFGRLLRRNQASPGFDKRIYRDVQACGYDDVHVMWSMLHHNSPRASITPLHRSAATSSATPTSASTPSSSSTSAHWPSPTLWHSNPIFV